MKNTGKTINGIPVYSDPDVPPGTMYMLPKGNLKKKLTRKEVKAYERLSGFKTTGDVTYEQSSDEVFNLCSDLITKQPRRTGKLTNIEKPKQ